jgi:hypothetical protein
LLPSGAFAAVIVDQSIDLTNDLELAASESDFDVPLQAADDFATSVPFSLSPRCMVVLGYHGPTNTPTASDDFTIRFYEDADGSPAISPVFEFPVGDVGRTDTGVDAFDSDIYAYTACT